MQVMALLKAVGGQGEGAGEGEAQVNGELAETLWTEMGLAPDAHITQVSPSNTASKLSYACTVLLMHPLLLAWQRCHRWLLTINGACWAPCDRLQHRTAQCICCRTPAFKGHAYRHWPDGCKLWNAGCLAEGDGAAHAAPCRAAGQHVCGQCHNTGADVPRFAPPAEQTLSEAAGAADPQIPAAPQASHLCIAGLHHWHLLQSSH